MSHGESSGLRAERAPIRLEGVHARALETARNRILVAAMLLLFAFVAVACRLIALTAFSPPGLREFAARSAWEVSRADIVDRNGVVLATSLPTASLYADPSEVMDLEETVSGLASVFPDLDRQTLTARLGRGGRFVWIRRNLTPDQQYAVNRLGLPGLAFVAEARRVYPQGADAAHLLGFTDIDGHGLAGVERSFDRALAAGETVRLAVDIRLQSIVRQELLATMRRFRAIGAAGLVLDVRTGEVLTMVSLPDFDPNRPAADDPETRFNRVSQGAYEMGSTFKLLTAAMALDSGTTTLNGGYDASHPIRVARFSIRDFKPENRWLSVPEILVHSSNIGAAQMALDVGGALQRKYLDRLGLLMPATVELPEVATPLAPARWRDVNTMTIGFGHGIAVSPVQLASAIAAVVNGGIYQPPTVLRWDGAPPGGERVLSAQTSEQVRALMRLVVLAGTGARADVPGLRVGGKTGTSEKLVGGRYRRDARIASFVGAFPIDAPSYVVFAMIDEPKGIKETHNYATGGWVAAPAIGRIVARIAPILGVAPVVEDESLESVRRQPAGRQRLLPTAIHDAMAEVRGHQLAAN